MQNAGVEWRPPYQQPQPQVCSCTACFELGETYVQALIWQSSCSRPAHHHHIQVMTAGAQGQHCMGGRCSLALASRQASWRCCATRFWPSGASRLALLSLLQQFPNIVRSRRSVSGRRCRSEHLASLAGWRACAIRSSCPDKRPASTQAAASIPSGSAATACSTCPKTQSAASGRRCWSAKYFAGSFQ